MPALQEEPWTNPFFRLPKPATHAAGIKNLKSHGKITSWIPILTFLKNESTATSVDPAIHSKVAPKSAPWRTYRNSPTHWSWLCSKVAPVELGLKRKVTVHPFLTRTPFQSLRQIYFHPTTADDFRITKNSTHLAWRQTDKAPGKTSISPSLINGHAHKLFSPRYTKTYVCSLWINRKF